MNEAYLCLVGGHNTYDSRCPASGASALERKAVDESDNQSFAKQSRAAVAQLSVTRANRKHCRLSSPAVAVLY